MASGSSDDTVLLWQVSDGSLLQNLEGHNYWVQSVAFSPDGKILASGSYDGTIALWQVADGSLIHTLEGNANRIASVTFSPDGQILALVV